MCFYFVINYRVKIQLILSLPNILIFIYITTFKTTIMKQFFSELFQDETGSFSSKRFIGIIAGLTLCATLVGNSLYGDDIKPADSLVNAVAMLSFGCLGLASVDKIWAKRPDETKPEEKAEEEE